MKKVDLTYQLTYEEAYEAFKVLATRRSRSYRIAVSVILAAASAVLLVLYAMDGTRLHYMFLAVLSIVMLFYIIYQPVLTARRGAARVARAAGTYHVVLHGNGLIDLPGEQGISIRGDKFARLAETDTVFALRPDASHTICIPRRILSSRETEFIRDLYK